MQNLVFTQLKIEEIKDLFRRELENYFLDNPISPPINPETDQPEYISKRKAAKLADVCTSTVDNWARAGKIKRHYFGSAVRFNRVEFLGYLEGKKSGEND